MIRDAQPGRAVKVRILKRAGPSASNRSEIASAVTPALFPQRLELERTAFRDVSL